MKIVAFDGTSQFVFDIQPPRHVLFHDRIKDSKTRSALSLGLIHGRVSFLQHVGRDFTVATDADTDADGSKYFASTAQRNRCRHAVQNSLSNCGRTLFRRDVFDENCKFVATKAGNERIRHADRAFQPARYRHQHPITVVVAEAVVDEFEVIQIQIQ